MSSARNFLKDYEKELVINTIRKAELDTTGEIRVHIDEKCEGNVMDRALKLFHELKMNKTRYKNGVMLYIATEDKKFAIIGDEGIHKIVNSDFWNTITKKLQKEFAQANFCNGIVESVQKIGAVLKLHFPNTNNWNENELNDEISFE